jgi:transcriptional regulator with XRE-family HTH domain
VDDAIQVGARIRQRREELGLSLSRLGELADVSKGYLWSLEKGETKARPSGQTLYRLAKALGTTMSDLLGRSLLVDAPDEIPKSLEEFAESIGLPERDKRMLAQISFRGEQPQHPADWAFIYRAIEASVHGTGASARNPGRPAPSEAPARARKRTPAAGRATSKRKPAK